MLKYNLKIWTECIFFQQNYTQEIQCFLSAHLFFCWTNLKPVINTMEIHYMSQCKSVSAARPVVAVTLLRPIRCPGQWHAYTVWPPSSHQSLHPLSLNSFRIYQFLISHNLCPFTSTSQGYHVFVFSLFFPARGLLYLFFLFVCKWKADIIIVKVTL